MKKLIIDADSICFHSDKIENEEQAKAWLDSKIECLKNFTKIDQLEFYITRGKNLRYEIQSDYKANRKDKNLPKFISFLKDYLISDYNAIFDTMYEADDLVVDRYKEDIHNHVIASIDKDILKNVVGTHFNLKKNEYITTNEKEAFDNFHRQMIIGDSIDNIPSLHKGLGIITIDKLLSASKLNMEELAMCLCQIKNVNYKNRYRMLYCGKELPIIEEKSIQNLIVEKYILGDIKLNNVPQKKPKKIYFGKYKGKTFDFVLKNDKGYLEWLHRETNDNTLKNYLSEIL